MRAAVCLSRVFVMSLPEVTSHSNQVIWTTDSVLLFSMHFHLAFPSTPCYSLTAVSSPFLPPPSVLLSPSMSLYLSLPSATFVIQKKNTRQEEGELVRWLPALKLF
ncbi:hypothetical protein XELAEV_18011044mg [Xenopus laevis]|uniref:Uncharacterized protein n=1 Tax=Xenopus laevis TaxID=8355 RepID=A0A974I230_XENLA|nr:hypothetical protein XELAEV_18011044mg [Xenopus laevis]